MIGCWKFLFVFPGSIQWHILMAWMCCPAQKQVLQKIGKTCVKYAKASWVIVIFICIMSVNNTRKTSSQKSILQIRKWKRWNVISRQMQKQRITRICDHPVETRTKRTQSVYLKIVANRSHYVENRRRHVWDDSPLNCAGLGRILRESLATCTEHMAGSWWKKEEKRREVEQQLLAAAAFDSNDRCKQFRCFSYCDPLKTFSPFACLVFARTEHFL